MHKIYILALCLLAGSSVALAQTDDTFQFVTADGTVVPDGSTITVTNVEEDELSGKVEMKSGLYVKYNDETGGAYLSVGYSVSAPNGTVQLCFPINCTTITSTGETGVGAMKAGDDPKDLQTEWFPTAYGTATVAYTIKRYEYMGMGGSIGLTPIYEYLNDCATVTVNYEYKAPANISGVNTDAKPLSTTYYDMAGRIVMTPRNGLYIKKAVMANGTVSTAKVLIKD